MNDFISLQKKEWLETNGLGGWASSTVSGAHSRRYHGLLVAATHPPVGRMVMLSKLDESIVIGEERFELGANQYPGAIWPQGFQHLKSFERDLFPVFEYEVAGIHLRKTIVAIHGENTTVILYEVVSSEDEFKLELLPLASCRDYHSLAHANDYIGQQYIFDEGIFRTLNYQGCPELFISVPGSSFTPDKNWFYNFEYAAELQRGLDFKEDLYSHGSFSITLKNKSKLGIIISTDDPNGKDAFKLFQKEKKRRTQVVKNFASEKNLARLALAADQFVVKRGKLKTIIAGYHWFSDWGRDTMISLPGLCLVTERYDDAKNILKAFAESVSNGMIPNRFPDFGETPEYNTVDATLWFFHAVYQYYQYTSDKKFIHTLLPVLKEIIQWHNRGTRYNIHVDTTGLIFAGADGVQLTWMDAKVGDWVVTPRRGKPVEINALWYNALCMMAEFLDLHEQHEEATEYRLKASQVKESFIKAFWFDEGGYLYDYVAETKNADFRPNQLYAISLPFPLLDEKQSQSVLEKVEKKLLTPRGLRSLSPDHPAYKGHYGHSIWERDGAYHQGTVWSFLLGSYIDAWMQVKGEKGKTKAKRVLQHFFEHLDEAGIGTVSEIFEGDEPHSPCGCIAQAWGVAEILRVAIEYELFPVAKTKATVMQSKETEEHS
jgi:predicted glycogen debranching enzyme